MVKIHKDSVYLDLLDHTSPENSSKPSIDVMFEDRKDAGQKLGKELEKRRVRPDLVLAVPRGGLPLGREVADYLDAPLDVVVARKIGAPKNPELAIGAVASDGSYWLNENMINRQKIDDKVIEKGIKKEAENARNKLELLRGTNQGPELEGKTVVVIDDGIATGATMIGCLRQLKGSEAKKVIVAVPVGPEGITQKLEDEADEIVVVETPSVFGSVGSHYRVFDQISDFEAKKYLD